MYNRYLPEEVSYSRVDSFPSPEPRQSGNRRLSFHMPDFLTQKEGLSNLLKGLRLDKIDSGDILLLLIALYLLAEGDDLELAIALGLTVFME